MMEMHYQMMDAVLSAKLKIIGLVKIQNKISHVVLLNNQKCISRLTQS
jgi:hypothetical protein